MKELLDKLERLIYLVEYGEMEGCSVHIHQHNVPQGFLSVAEDKYGGKRMHNDQMLNIPIDSGSITVVSRDIKIDYE